MTTIRYKRPRHRTTREIRRGPRETEDPVGNLEELLVELGVALVVKFELIQDSEQRRVCG